MATTTFAGRLVADPELKQVSGTDVLKMRVAEDVGFGDKKATNWFSVDVWRGASALAKILAKGSFVIVSGELVAREYEAQGQKRTSLDVRADRVQLGPKTGSGGGQATQGTAASSHTSVADDEVPF